MAKTKTSVRGKRKSIAKTVKKTTRKKTTRKKTTRKKAARRPAAGRKRAAAKGGRKKAAKKKSGAKQTTRKKPGTRKTGKKSAAKKAARRGGAAAGSRGKKAASRSKVPAKGSGKSAGSRSRGKTVKAGTTGKPASGRRKLGVRQKKEFRELLLGLRERLSGQIAVLKHDSLQRVDEVNTLEDGTDAFDRQMALDLASSEQESLAEIDEALRRLDDDAYGICEECGDLIEAPRLRALPFVRNCVACQSKLEVRTGGGRRALVLAMGSPGK